MKDFQKKWLKLLPAFLRQYRRRRICANTYMKYEMAHPGDYKSNNCFDYYKCIFIHIPKTAGRSISKSLFGNYSGGNEKITFYLKKFGRKTVNRYYKFAFVRNPWDRLYSAYNYLTKGGSDENDRLFYKESLSHLENFEDFVIKWLDESKLETTSYYFIPQYRYLSEESKPEKLLVDFIGRFENIDKDFAALCRLLKFPRLKLPQINVTNTEKNAYLKVYTPAMIDKVTDLYKKDILLFNYSFI